MKINIVMDNKNNWYYGRVAEIMKKIKSLGHGCKLYQNQKQVPPNSDVTFYLGHEGYVTKQNRQKSKYNIVAHASDLPKGKGMSPATWQILDGKVKIPVTLFEMADKIDAGDYYLKDSFKLDGTELIIEWQDKLGACVDKMIIKFLKNIKNLKPIKQTGHSSVYPWRHPEDSELDINKAIKQQFNLLRVVDNEKYPAFFKYKNNRYIIKIYKE
ncbi:hypothetical protein A3I35_01875 [Candidatus Falkowbacteria bacterium RIFCSPLOWO2_02_FULL_45_15]|uniref:Formyl transferase N-terminal domain-containing protein n=2 Tax=Candidatus Falkowiibacteriota TaxID=1752728 RepID=A0A1F5RJG8_9BACT|nr:MAG: hypothetical protein A3D54_01540 [Candidatus Falkowbacteria bacterium RIFCSPHIGHO2_02_FULL_45_15]OGF19574.1 MAG: hypothetical protein A3I35_01875 [Candidatus Falkowbacteria bacterium RIFCSPLOWO2_02_FULL_45_15]